ncbi:hypothetical protein B0H13DRAFT_2317578 [Mycena leptocephala]|nr:hypothetical protein B0H13DRAFT_2317578 [Mycena leptocephala]
MTSLPRRPSSQRVQSTGWSLHSTSPYVAACCVPVPRRGSLGDDAEGKGTESAHILLDDAQLEFDAKSCQKRCRIMAALTLPVITYLPGVVAAILFSPRIYQEVVIAQ